jgi:hypothetical protein
LHLSLVVTIFQFVVSAPHYQIVCLLSVHSVVALLDSVGGAASTATARALAEAEQKSENMTNLPFKHLKLKTYDVIIRP